MDKWESIAENRDLIVQTTRVGMEPDIDRDPLPNYSFTGDEVVFELIYQPNPTRFLARAQAAGCAAINGLEMLRCQGEAQFKYFTGREYPELSG